MGKISVFVKVFGAGVGNDSSIGLVNGDLQWCSAPGFSGWASGMFNPEDIDIASQAFNPSAGGGLGGFDGETELTITDLGFAGQVASGAVHLSGKQMAVWIGTDVSSQSNAVLKFNGTISSYDTPKKTTTRIISDSSISLDLKKIPSIVVTKEMALNVQDSSAIGKTISPVYGNRVIYPMVYCDASDATIAALVTTTGRTVPAGDLQFNGLAPDVMTNSPWSEMMLPDGSFMIGKSMLEVVAAWQSSETSNVWVVLSFNGKTLFADASVQSILINLKKAFVGRRFKGIHGTGKGNSYLITDIDYTTHEVQVDNTDVTSLWFQLDTTSLSDIRYSLPAYTTSRVGGNSNAPLYLRDLGMSDSASNLFVGANRDGKPDTEVSYLSFQADAGAFIVPASANTGAGAKVLAKTESGYTVAIVPSAINTLYESSKWKLVQFDMDSDFGSDEAQFLQVEPVEITSYLLENRAGSFAKYLNAIGITPSYGGSFVLTDLIDSVAVSSELTLVPPAGLNLVADAGDQYTITARSQNTLYIPSDPSIFLEGFDLRIMPDIKMSFQQPAGLTSVYNIVFEFDLFAIAENNIAISKASFSATTKFDGWASAPSADFFHIDPSTKSFKFSQNNVSHGQSSESLYSTMEKALFMGSDQLSDNKKIIRGFILSIGVRYEWVSFNSGLDFRHATKTIKPATIYLSKTADKRELYLENTSGASVTAPVRIAQQVAEANGIVCNTASFDAVEALQRAYFSTTPSEFDGQYGLDASESVSDILDSIGKQTMTAFFRNASGELSAKFLPSTPSSVSIAFDGGLVVKDSLSISMPKNGYIYSDFDFEVKSHPLIGTSIVSVDTDGTDTFPEEGNYPIGDVIFSPALANALIYIIGGPSAGIPHPAEYRSVVVRCESRTMLSMFVPGTFWKGSTDDQNYRVYRLDTIAPDPDCSIYAYGVRLGFRIEKTVGEPLDVFDGIHELRLWGPNPLWKSYVSGLAVDNYAIASSMWNSAKGARALLGREQKMPDTVTKLKQPIWGSDSLAITRWVCSVVSYGSAQKVVIRFDTPINAQTNLLKVMDYATFAWGPYKDSSINGYVCSIKPSPAEGSLSITLLCIGDFSTLPSLLEEGGVPLAMESGDLIALEDETSGSEKISELTLSSPQAVAQAGGVMVTAIEGVGNNKVSLSEVSAWIVGVAEDYTDEIFRTHVEALDPHPQYVLRSESATSDHEKLDNLLGGDSVDGHFHLTLSQKDAVSKSGQAGGAIVSDANNYIPISQIPASLLGAVRYQGTWNASTNTPTLAQPPSATTKGYYYITSVAGTFNSVTYNISDWIISDGTAWQKIDNTDAVTSVAGRTGAVVLTKTDVGLANVDNTSDANKPISTATQTALNAKQNQLTFDTVPTNDSSNPVTSNGVFDALAGKAKEPTLYINRLAGDNNASVKICEWQLSKTDYTGGSFTLRIWKYDTWQSDGYIDVMFRYKVTGSEATGSWSFEQVGGSAALATAVSMRYTADTVNWYFAINAYSNNPRILSQLLNAVNSNGEKNITMGFRNVADSGGTYPLMLAPTPPAGDNSTKVANTAWVQNAFGGFPRKFHYRYGSPDGVHLWTEIASFTPSVSTHYFFSLELTQAGNDFSWSNCPFSVHFSFYNTGTVDANSFRVSGRWLTDYTNSAGIRYGISGGVVKVYLYNWSNWVTAYAGTIIHDSHGVVNFSSSTTSDPTAYPNNQGIIRGTASDADKVDGKHVVVQSYNTAHNDGSTIYLLY